MPPVTSKQWLGMPPPFGSTSAQEYVPSNLVPPLPSQAVRRIAAATNALMRTHGTIASMSFVRTVVGAFAGVAPSLLPRELRLRAALWRVDRVLIRDVRVGAMVKVVGRALPVTPVMTAPLTLEPCVYYSSLCEAGIEGSEGIQWTCLLNRERRQDFLVDDGTGSLLVHLGGARVRQFGGRVEGLPQGASNLFAQQPHPSELADSSKVYRYEETIIRPGAFVAVLGRVRVAAGPDQPSPAARLAFGVDPDDEPIVSAELEAWVDHAQ